MTSSRVREIKHAQKESNFFHHIAQFILQIKQDEPSLSDLSFTRVELSPDGGLCTLFFSAPGGLQAYEKMRTTLVLYKPSLRSALAQSIPGRYIPSLRFAYDKRSEKQRRIDELLDRIKREEP